eukprot:TRINITY_DN3468_c0_g1_i1.p1 TRINITY_DN3468_c0_g1~~TRINITY_DN3468_c0_g1_i1.p1  ORF type:complete len:267 (+),score=21.18 TRINITY_DN3468_c0_g1_i1:11-811(+)
MDDAGVVPFELLCEVLGHLMVRDLYAVSRVSRRWNTAFHYEPMWHERCQRHGITVMNDRSWQATFRNETMWMWDKARANRVVSISTDGLSVVSSGTCHDSGKNTMAKCSFSSGRCIWGIEVTGQTAGCRSGVGIATAEFDWKTGVLGMDPKSWGLAMSPGEQKHKGPRRIEVPLRLETGAFVLLDLNLSKEELLIYTILANEPRDVFLPRPPFATFSLKELRSGPGLERVYPVVATCHYEDETYKLLPPATCVKLGLLDAIMGQPF